MGSEIAFLFGPLSLAVIFALGYCASKPRFRVAAVLCAVLAAFVSLGTVDVVPSYSFWTQAGFYGFVFIAATLVALPAMLGASKIFQRR
jgi:hypothetical protein